MSERITCQCAHGDVLNNEGHSLAACPAGHSREPCSAEAEQRLVLVTGLGRPDGQVELCQPCAEAWLAEGEWVEPATWEEHYLALLEP